MSAIDIRGTGGRGRSAMAGAVAAAAALLLTLAPRPASADSIPPGTLPPCGWNVNGVIDTDADGICDDVDNCLYSPNPTQLDTNSNGIGDACEATCANIRRGLFGTVTDTELVSDKPNQNFGSKTTGMAGWMNPGARMFLLRFDLDFIPAGSVITSAAVSLRQVNPNPSTVRVHRANALAARVQKRMTRWLRRRGLLDDSPAEERSNEAPEPTPLETCMQLSLFGGTFLRLDESDAPLNLDDERFRARGKSPWAAEVGGFNVHAGVTVRAGDRDGKERLFRYGARPPFSLERISILEDGRVAYLLRKPRRNGATHLVLDPVHFLARIASIIPPPRFPLTRLSGVFAPKSPWRASVVPKALIARGAAPTSKRAPKKTSKKPSAAATSILAEPADTRSKDDAPPPSGPRTSLASGVTKPIGARIDWASLLRRIYLEDVLSCPCGGRRRIVADISESSVIVAILEHLGLPTEAPPKARARSPSFDAA